MSLSTRKPVYREIFLPDEVALALARFEKELVNENLLRQDFLYGDVSISLAYASYQFILTDEEMNFVFDRVIGV